MFKRPLLLLGLLLGTFAAFRLRLPSPRPLPPQPLPLWGLVTDPLVVCNRAGTVTKANASAQALLGPSYASLAALRYLTGQAVPPGQHPVYRALGSREAGPYRFLAADGSERILAISARSLPDGSVLARLQDTTTQHESDAREEVAQARQRAVRTVCRRLSQAQTADAVGEAVTEEIRALLGSLPDVQVRLWVLDPLTDTLTCIASSPDDRPKRPLSAAQLLPKTVRFDVQMPELWQLYVARRPFENSLPLFAAGIAIGHLAISSEAALEDPAQRETLEVIASLAALALAGPSASGQTAALAAQADAVREITLAAARGSSQSDLADLVTLCIKRLVGAKVCTLSVPIHGKLSVLGEAFQDDLLSPKTAPNDPRLHSKAVQKACRTGKTGVQIGIANPTLEAGPWRAFAGRAGCHILTALPLTAERGVLAVYTEGAAPLPEPQIKLIQTLAAILSLSFAPASATEEHAN